MSESIIDNYYKQAVKSLTEAILNDENKWYNSIMNLPLHLQVVYTIANFHRQVFNGGFHQYFFNPYGMFAFITVNNLKLIKAYKTAEILSRALAEVNKEQFSEREFRTRIFNRRLEKIVNFDEDLGNLLNRLDNEYYNSEEDIESLLQRYLLTMHLSKN